VPHLDLEGLRDALRDDSLHILLGLVSRVAIAPDRSTCRVMVSILPEQRPIVATMTWDAVGSEAGFYMLPEPGDLVLVGQAEGDVEQAFILRRLSSSEEKIPANVDDGSIVLKSVAGKKIWVTSDTRINLSKADGTPSENLVLGQVLKTVLGQFMQKFIEHTHIGNMGFQTTAPSNATDVTSLKSGNVDNEGILSQIAFTEKGS
jgi:hypothetical protein